MNKNELVGRMKSDNCYQALKHHFVVEVRIGVLHENVEEGIQNVLQEFDCLLAVNFH